MSSYKYGKKARRLSHDHEQARRRSLEQNQKIIEIIEGSGAKPSDYWGYSDLPPEGGVLDLSCIGLGKRWIIQIDGTTKEKPYA